MLALLTPSVIKMSEYLEKLLSLVAKNNNWENFEIDAIDKESGNGFSGEFFLASIINTDTKEKLDLAIKKTSAAARMNTDFDASRGFGNEIYFYKKIAPTLLEFKDSKNIGEKFDFFAKFYMGLQDDVTDSLVLENLRITGYNVLGRTKYVDDELALFVFRTLGKFHALSFAFKDQNPEEYRKLNEGVYTFIESSIKSVDFKNMLNSACKSAFDCVDERIREKGRKYIDDTIDVYANTARYTGKYSCIIHGDCWSNNMMFKYQDSKLAGIRLIDFPGARDSTPIHDLSYFFYTSGTKKIFQNLDKYLQTYYETFSNTCQDLGSDPNKIYPFKALKEDWKKYFSCGFMMALLVNKIKLAENEAVNNLGETDFFDGFAKIQFSDQKLIEYQQKMRDLIGHAYEHQFF